MITRLLEVRGGRPGKTVQMTEAEVRALCVKSREIFLSQEWRLDSKIARLLATFSSQTCIQSLPVLLFTLTFI